MQSVTAQLFGVQKVAGSSNLDLENGKPSEEQMAMIPAHDTVDHAQMHQQVREPSASRDSPACVLSSLAHFLCVREFLGASRPILNHCDDDNTCEPIRHHQQ